MRTLLLLIALTLPAGAGEIARWSVAGGAHGLTIAGGAIEGSAAVLPPSGDYYSRAAYVLTAEPAPARDAWLALEYLDRGYGLISLSVAVRESDQSGVARVNTGKWRQAIFHLAPAALAHPVRIFGITALRRATLSDTPLPPAVTPDVPPALTLRTASQRVTTAGADSRTPEELPEALASLRNLLPLARALGFNGIESYVKWNFVERRPGVFDWSYYDAILDELDRHGMKWFPLLIVGSAYTLPPWYHDSPDNIGFECLEHHLGNDIQSIFAHTQDRYVERFLSEFGRHYAARSTLLGIRLGPSGNYGEAQYPARGAWGYQGRPIHTHIGYWAADRYAVADFRRAMRKKYAGIAALNAAWDTRFDSFDAVSTFLPVTAASPRRRIDFDDWYMDAMSAWCEQWARWARQALPHAVVDQSSGGWGPVEIGTDYTAQARAMARLHGGIRLTNESDNYSLNFAITRMAASAARFYGAELGFEPGGYGTARGVVARLFNAITNGAQHLFYYHPNLYANDQGCDAWLRNAPLFDRRAKPLIDVAVFYPDTAIKLDDEPLRYLWGSVFLDRAQDLRSVTDYDYVSEPMVRDGALDRYKVLVFLWGDTTEKAVLERIDRWVRAGGVVIYPERPRGLLATVEGDNSVSRAWRAGDAGRGRAVFFPGETTPGRYYARFVLDQLRGMEQLRPPVRAALRMSKPADTYWSVLENGALALLNFSDDAAEVELDGGPRVRLAPYSIWMR